jgi:hypothetical protein
MCYTSESVGESLLQYVQLSEPVNLSSAQNSYTAIQLTNDKVKEQSCHTFDSLFSPVRLEINGRKGRRVVCALSNDRNRYKIYDLDSDATSDHDGEAAPMSEGSAMSE